MAEFPALPLFTDAYLADTTHLSATEHGAYLLLLITMWRSPGCRLPNNATLLAKYSKLTAGQWSRIGPTLMQFFEIDGGFITQGRLTDEAAFVRRNSKRQSDKARSRWLKHKSLNNATALPDRYRNDAPTPTPTIDGASAPSDEKQLFDRGVAVLGPKGRGLIAKLLKSKNGSIPLARAAIEQASTKSGPAEYIGRIIAGHTERHSSKDESAGVLWSIAK